MDSSSIPWLLENDVIDVDASIDDETLPFYQMVDKKHFLGQKIQQKYTINKKIGQGQFGVCYNATNMGTNEQICLKLINFDVMEVQEQESNMREVQILYQVHQNPHPFIISMYNFFFVTLKNVKGKKTTYLCMEFELCEGDISKFAKNLSINDIAVITVQLLVAVHYLHHFNIIHRDLKMQNILYKNDQIKLSDFGFAKNAIATGTVLGTPLYLAPEILYNYLNNTNNPYTNVVDVWSIGVIVYEFLTKEKAFNPDNQPNQVLYKNIQNINYNKDKVNRHILGQLVYDFLVPDKQRPTLQQYLRINPEDQQNEYRYKLKSQLFAFIQQLSNDFPIVKNQFNIE